MSFITTYSGLIVDPAELRPEHVLLQDIGHSLSMQCRFTGHTREFYSVAEHSVYVAQEVWRRGGSALLVCSALMHDACEAYVGDMARPVKDRGDMAEFQEMERCAQHVIAFKYGLERPDHPEIVRADEAALRMEQEHLMWGAGAEEGPDLMSSSLREKGPLCLPPGEAKALFLSVLVSALPLTQCAVSATRVCRLREEQLNEMYDTVEAGFRG